MDNIRIQIVMAAIIFLAPILLANNLHAEKKGGVELGLLTCESLPKSQVKIFLRTSVRVKCTFTASRLQGRGQGGKSENYVGEFGLLGIDLSIKSAQKMRFVVFGLTSDIKIGSHSLQGDYNGVQATVGIGVGGGPNHLLGGWKQGFSLAPSLETHKGIGVTLGGTRLNLEPAK